MKTLFHSSGLIFLFAGFITPKLATGSEMLPSFPRFNELKKITVGPDDQLDQSINSSGQLMVFTQQANMISHLQIQELSTGKTKDLLPKTSDSIQGKFNEFGQVVFVYFKENSKGDICYTDKIKSMNELPLTSSKIHCLIRIPEGSKTERSQPFWSKNNEISFLEKDLIEIHLQSASLDKVSELRTLARGPAIFAPSGSPQGNNIIYTQRVEDKVQLVLLDLLTHEEWIVPIAIPGITGFASLGDDGETLYFSHFIGDSNQDSIIDGHDNSVVWKTNISAIKAYARKHSEEKEHELSIKQLTPMDFNCSFPTARKNRLFITCAFEGSLDIYSLSSEGFIPHSWSESTIKNALESARSYQDRILLLNTLKSRSEDLKKRHALDEELFNVHLLADEISAALYYADHIPSIESLKIFLRARLLKKNQPANTKMYLFKEAMQSYKTKLEKIKGEKNLKSLVTTNITAMEGSPVDFLKVSRSLTAKSTPIEYWLYFNLAQELFPKNQEHAESWIRVFKKMVAAYPLSTESKLYYTFEMLCFLEPMELPKRKKILISFVSDIEGPAEVQALIESEINGLALIEGRDKKEKLLALQEIDKLLRRSQKQYFLRKAMNVRSVLNFLNHQEFQQLNVVAANWLRDTPASSTEFSYARDVVIAAAREEAYGYWSKGNARLASDYFFQSLSLTDDLESHAGYVNTMLEISQRKNMEDRLLYLQKHGAIKDSLPLIKALLKLDDGETAANQWTASDSDLNEVLKELQSLRTDLNDPILYLIEGYTYLERFRRSKKGVIYDDELWQKAQHSLILAVDLARGRRRIQAAALSNLGLLYLWGQNPNQSLHFWEQRKQLGFDDPQMIPELQAFTWYYSQALFLANKAKQASEEISNLPALLQTPEFMERRAFYLAVAEDFPESLKAYEKVLQGKGPLFEKLPEPGRTKVRLGFAYALFRSSRLAEAKKVFEKILFANAGRFDAEESSRSMAFDPEEIEVLVWGFLAQMGTDTEKIQALEKRISLIKDDPASLIQAQMKLSELITMQNPKKATELMQKTMKDCRIFSEDNGPLGQTVFRTLANYMIHGLLNKDYYRGIQHQDLQTQIEKTLLALSRQEASPSLQIKKEQWRLNYLWTLFQEQILKQAQVAGWQENLKKNSLALEVFSEDPKGFSALVDEMNSLN